MRLVPALLAAALVAGCATFEPKPLSPAESAAGLESRRLDDAGLRRFVEANVNRGAAPWPPAAWDLSLLTLAAFYFHPDLDVARAKEGVAEAGVITASARPNPTFSFNPQYVTDALEHVSTPWIFGFRLDVPIETMGKRGYRIERAKHLGEAARVDIATVAWTVRSRLRTALLDLYAADEKLELRRRELALRRELTQLVEQRLAAGEASELDALRERVALDRSAIALADAERQRSQARAALTAAIGVPAAALDGVTVDFSAVEGASLRETAAQNLRREALVGRADVQAALARYAAAESLLRLEVAKQYPDIRMSPGYTFEQGQNNYVLGASLTLPLLDQNQGPIAEAEARRRQAAAEFDALQLEVIAAIDAASAAYRDASETLSRAESLAARQADRTRRTDATFRAGEADRVALLGAGLEQVATDASRIDAVVARQKAVGLLEDALQRPLGGSAAPGPVSPERSPREGSPRER